jgi:hypothetical protein
MVKLLVFTNLPDRTMAQTLAQALIERRLAACVNVLADCTSVYRWEGKVESRPRLPDTPLWRRRSATFIPTTFRRSSPSRSPMACPSI